MFNTVNVKPHSKTDFSEEELDETLIQMFESHKDLESVSGEIVYKLAVLFKSFNNEGSGFLTIRRENFSSLMWFMIPYNQKKSYNK